MKRARMMLATQSQATFGQGSHGLVMENLDYLKKVRADIMRSLWKMDAYSCSPLVTMAILVPVQLDPESGCIYEGLRAIMRYVRRPAAAAELKRRFYMDPSFPVDGPAARLKTLADTSILGRHIYTLVNGEHKEGDWLHRIREGWRNFLWGRHNRLIGSGLCGGTIPFRTLLIKKIMTVSVWRFRRLGHRWGFLEQYLQVG